MVESVIANNIKAIFSTNKQLNLFLTYGCGIYLPSEECVTVYFLKYIMSEVKLVREINFQYYRSLYQDINHEDAYGTKLWMIVKGKLFTVVKGEE